MKANTQWQPSASIETLKARAKLLAQIRQFFANRNVTEVDTPLLASAGVTDLHLHNLKTEFIGPGFANGIKLHLQTSPEYAMKRLLAAGSGCIYQICKAVRDDEAGRYHNVEFTMLEWYRLGFDDTALINEVNQLIQLVLNTPSAKRITYQQAFIEHLAIDPLTADIKQLKDKLTAQGEADLAKVLADKDSLLQALFSFYIEPQLANDLPCFVTHFPATQAALAKLDNDDPRTARRFELYYQGVELANGFYELTDSQEQQLRFTQDNKARIEAGLPDQRIDEKLIAALEHGLPDCAGVALGIDRLMMLALNKPHIDEVIAFPLARA